MRTLLISLLLLFPAMPASSQPGSGRGDRVAGRPFASRSPVLARHGMAATSHPLASQAALDVLKAGGSAVDAAIAANAMLGLVEPTGGGIGGDLFAIVWDPATRRLYGLNASGRAANGFSLEAMRREAAARAPAGAAATIPIVGPLSVSVPGTVDGWFALHGRFGRLSMDAVLAPAIRYAREGFPITQTVAHEMAAGTAALEAAADLVPFLEGFRRTYLIDGRAPREGEVFRNADLARTYEAIAAGGRDAFYRGELARVMDAYLRRVGAPVREADLAAHQSTWVTPVSVNYRGYDVYELPPNGQGVAALQMLNLLEGYDLAALGHNSADYLHVHAEAKKLAFEDRAHFYADPAFVDVPLEGLLSKAYADRRRQRIRMDQALREVEHGDPRLERGDTVYLTVADSSGMMVSLIQSVFLLYGSGLVPDGLGFVLHNRGALFALQPDHANVYAPGKRPFQTIIPAFVMKDGEPFMSFGVMGGPMQPQGHVQVLCNLIDFGMNVQEAGDAARYRHEGSSEVTGTTMTDGGVLFVESGVAPEAVAELERRGHQVRVAPEHYGGYQAIRWDPVHRVYHGASEMRKDGQVVGY